MASDLFCPMAHTPLQDENLSGSPTFEHHPIFPLKLTSPVQHYVERHQIDPPGLYRKSNLKKRVYPPRIGVKPALEPLAKLSIKWADPIAVIHEISSRESSVSWVDDLATPAFPEASTSTGHLASFPASTPTSATDSLPYSFATNAKEARSGTKSSAEDSIPGDDHDFGDKSISLVKSYQESPDTCIVLDMPQKAAPRDIGIFNLRHLAPLLPGELANPEEPCSLKLPSSNYPFQHQLSARNQTLDSELACTPEKVDKHYQHPRKRRERPTPTRSTHYRPSKALKLDNNTENLQKDRVTPHIATSPATSVSESSHGEGNDSDDSLFGDTDSDFDSNGQSSKENKPPAQLVRLHHTSEARAKENRFRSAIEHQHEEEKRRRRQKFVPRTRDITVDKLRVTNWYNELARFHYLMENGKFNGEEHAMQLLQCLETIDRYKADAYITPAVLLESKIAQQIKVFRHAPYGRALKEVADRINKAWRALCQESGPKQ